ncbi:MAG: SsrA-binding protein [Chlorobiaceae bacterium]|nr:SsrA-binding protein [Chlorobiaceae bacterium]MBA4310605.1 SsrA-binding protein [Chlorobiaceae bacterium]
MNNALEIRNIVVNRKAEFEYFILQRYEAGIILKGTEVKSLREGKANFIDSYVQIKNGEVWLIGLHINEFKHGNINNHEPTRTRKLLLNRIEIRKLNSKVIEKGLTLVPLRIYLKGSLVKIEIGIAKGKKNYDKREDIKKKDLKREEQKSDKY